MLYKAQNGRILNLSVGSSVKINGRKLFNDIESEIAEYIGDATLPGIGKPVIAPQFRLLNGMIVNGEWLSKGNVIVLNKEINNESLSANLK